MLSYLTRLELDREVVKKQLIINLFNKESDLTLKEYLSNSFKEMPPYNKEVWLRVINKLIEPSFDERRYDEMVYVFGYLSKDDHDFEKQYKFYDELKNEKRLDEESKKFIGFMAGVGFFKQYEMNLEEWFNSYYWTRPDLQGNVNYKMKYTINDILNLSHGLNYFKTILPQLNYWRR
ncbi:hypothetical protein EDL99_08995 [Ornithobacterium rhinotracheale]|uniref:hypothetical protein n=1 Tax=Ornithobacterium rhinotracheale TaxID=28251 RepID=UPI00129C9660|nr:hypothetical protein [Ornithobacterium rhinotracheale]MRJ08994.1 hypothetical protein [Ornithobacterium rhinotracheale]UOH78893.1 hypothetical protein MT996_05340 [Ornithobacterium rhinotracheale]